ncbi:hypothetical protein [Ovoidimarina sediminis]|uniref:hypothetical protein n=1 Tax=Ovoidimarina sediminis TaxID=3079856 RepID=UPI002908E190|nr:hypothetical protein [Rhodophyticola sp. MJ-SS7]MDU8946159.1 hypothetical protein [Rhodophyticola sp. MJ-SS7]
MTRNEGKSEKRAYMAPRLETYGPISKLTTQNKPGTRTDGTNETIGNRGMGK